MSQLTEKQRDAVRRAVLALGIGIPAILLRAWCILRVYEWHFRALLGGPALTLSKVFVVWTMLSLLSVKYEAPKEEEPDKSALSVFVGRELGRQIFFPLACLAFAWFLR